MAKAETVVGEGCPCHYPGTISRTLILVIILKLTQTTILISCNMGTQVGDATQDHT